MDECVGIEVRIKLFLPFEGRCLCIDVYNSIKIVIFDT